MNSEESYIYMIQQEMEEARERAERANKLEKEKTERISKIVEENNKLSPNELLSNVLTWLKEQCTHPIARIEDLEKYKLPLFCMNYYDNDKKENIFFDKLKDLINELLNCTFKDEKLYLG